MSKYSEAMDYLHDFCLLFLRPSAEDKGDIGRFLGPADAELGFQTASAELVGVIRLLVRW